MPKPTEHRPVVVSSQKSEDNYNLESKREKLRKMGVSPLILRMYGDRNDAS